MWKGGMVTRMKSVSDKHSPAAGGMDDFSHQAAEQPSVAHPEADWQALVYEMAPLAYLNFDTHGRILDFNLAASRLLGISRKRGFHMPLTEVVSPRHRARLMRHIELSHTSRETTVSRIKLRPNPDSPQPVEVEMSTRPEAEAVCYRTQLLPISGAVAAAWPDADAKFRALVENSSEVICIGAPDGTIFYTTPSVKRVLGYEPASWFGRNAFEVMPPDQAELIAAAVRQLAASPTGSVIKVVTQVRHADGSWKWVEAALTNLIGQPAVGGIVCNYRDVTAARAAEEALRTSEARYRLLAEALPQMVSVRDDEGHLEYCNSRWRQYRNIDTQEAITHDWKTDVPPEDAPALQAPPLKEGELPRPWEGEVRVIRRPDGALRWHKVRVIPLTDPPGTLRWLVISSDIHERKQVERERERLLVQLQRERSELSVQYAVVRALACSSSLAAAAPQLLAAFCDQLGWQAGALWATRDDGSSRPTLVPIHLRQQLGITPAGVFRKSQPAALARSEGLAGRVWAGKKPLSQGGLSPVRGVAHHRAAAALGLKGAFAFPILLGGEVQGVVELFSREHVPPGERLLDIVNAIGIQIGQFIERTMALERLRQSEEALTQANNVLEQRVSERTAELHEANHELSAEIAERTRLEREIIRISEREQRRIGEDLHDGLCQELTAITLITRALSTRMSRTSAPETQRVNDVAQLLNASISRCRNIARGLHPVEMDADGLMVALDDLAQRTTQTVTCTFRCDRPILMPESDVALNLYRIAQEAVNNALKYSGASRIVIALSREGEFLRLSIADDGRGIPARTASMRKKQLSGMGLHIMRYRARTMGATLRIQDRKPHGAEVVCLLPRPT
jgi:PAS domain S-box-containing protein